MMNAAEMPGDFQSNDRKRQTGDTKQNTGTKRRKLEPISLRVNESKYKYTEDEGFAVPELKEFDFSHIKPDSTITLYGRRRLGKSFMLRYIMHMLAHYFAFGLVFTNTKLNQYWQNHMPDKFIHKGYKPAVLKKFLERQEILKLDPKYKNVNKRAFVILDDTISDPKVRSCKYVKSLYTEGRHSDTFVAITTQDAKGVTPTHRDNTDVSIIFQVESLRQRESLHDDLFSFATKDETYAVFNKYLNEDVCLVVLMDKTLKGWDKVYFAKAKDPGQFVLGSKEMWESGKK
jgi:hypothetical protein